MTTDQQLPGIASRLAWIVEAEAEALARYQRPVCALCGKYARHYLTTDFLGGDPSAYARFNLDLSARSLHCCDDCLPGIRARYGRDLGYKIVRGKTRAYVKTDLIGTEDIYRDD